jgi:DNA-binding transcriptional regulator YiaG
MTTILEPPVAFNRLDVRAWRRQRWLTQWQLSQLLGVHKQVVYRWEAGLTDVPAYLSLALNHLDTLHYWSAEGVDALPRLAPVS